MVKLRIFARDGDDEDGPFDYLFSVVIRYVLINILLHLDYLIAFEKLTVKSPPF